MTAHDDAVKAAAEALSVHLGDPGDWYDIAAVAVAAAAPILLAPVQAENELARNIHHADVRALRDARAEVEQLRGDVNWHRGRASALEAERDEARAEVARLQNELAEATAALTELAPLAPILADRRRIADAIRSECLRLGHSWDDFGVPRVCWTCGNSAHIAESSTY